MTQIQNLNEEKITVKDVFEDLSSDFKITYEELNRKLKSEFNYKHLKRVGEEQFYNVTSECNVEMERKNARLCFAKVSLLVPEVCKSVENLICEKFQESFVSSLKDKVLEAILKLHSERKPVEKAAEDFETLSEVLDIKLEEEKEILENVKDLSKSCADNLIYIRNQLIEMPFEEPDNKISSPKRKASNESKRKKLKNSLERIESSVVSNESKKKKMDTDISNIDDDDNSNISLESLSSVHTSDLSSFEDEIVFSSDEERGEKRKKMTIKEVEEKLAKVKNKVTTDEKNAENQAENIKVKDTSHSKASATGFLNVAQKSLSHRIRKPNSKYITDDIVTLLKRPSAEKKLTLSTTSPVCHEDNSLLRKRGRPPKQQKLDSSKSSPVCNMENSSLRKRGRPRKQLA